MQPLVFGDSAGGTVEAAGWPGRLRGWWKVREHGQRPQRRIRQCGWSGRSSAARLGCNDIRGGSSVGLAASTEPGSGLFHPERLAVGDRPAGPDRRPQWKGRAHRPITHTPKSTPLSRSAFETRRHRGGSRLRRGGHKQAETVLRPQPWLRYRPHWPFLAAQLARYVAGLLPHIHGSSTGPAPCWSFRKYVTPVRPATT